MSRIVEDIKKNAEVLGEAVMLYSVLQVIAKGEKQK